MIILRLLDENPAVALEGDYREQDPLDVGWHPSPLSDDPPIPPPTSKGFFFGSYPIQWREKGRAPALDIPPFSFLRTLDFLP